jgi:hypothetical protein
MKTLLFGKIMIVFALLFAPKLLIPETPAPLMVYAPVFPLKVQGFKDQIYYDKKVLKKGMVIEKISLVKFSKKSDYVQVLDKSKKTYWIISKEQGKDLCDGKCELKIVNNFNPSDRNVTDPDDPNHPNNKNKTKDLKKGK